MSPPTQVAVKPEPVDLDAVLAGGVYSDYQPIVTLDGNEIVGYEALARGPRGTSLHSPGQLFGAAAALGRMVELDRACRSAAVQGALLARLPASAALFVNVEPEAIAAEGGGSEDELIAAARQGLGIFVEVTERALTLQPARLLETIERMRARGLGIVLDDVGVDRRSLALLPLLRPDVVKLDMSVIHRHPSAVSGEVMNGVCAYAEQTGAAIVAEGIESDRHLMAARSMGATLVQGFFLGRPGPLPQAHACSRRPAIRLGIAPRKIPLSPALMALERRTCRVGRKDVLLSVTRALEAQALQLGEHAVVAACFQHARHFTARTERLYEQLGAGCGLVVALGVEMAEVPVAGVHGATIAPGDPLVSEWDIAVLGPHYAAALVARDLGDEGPDMERRFTFVLTFERDLVVDIAASLIGRITTSGTASPGSRPRAHLHAVS